MRGIEQLKARRELKELMKYYYMIESGEDYFSLSDCSVTTARLFINFLIEFAFQWDIPLMDPGLERYEEFIREFGHLYGYKG